MNKKGKIAIPLELTPYFIIGIIVLTAIGNLINAMINFYRSWKRARERE